MKKLLKRTRRIGELHDILTGLSKNFDKILNQCWWQRKVSIREKITYIETMAQYQSKLFAEINNEYPETVNTDCGVDTSNVYYEAKEDTTY